MARLIGFISNRGELGPRVLSAQAEHLKTHRASDAPLGWGIGFMQFGEVLLRRRPLDERPEIDLSQALEGIKTDVLIGHVRQPTVGNLKTENTHPFRYRQWLFAQTGTLEGVDQVRERLLEIQPAFLRPNVRGDTDSELMFYLFLSYLHDEGHLNGQQVPVETTFGAIRQTLKLIDGLCADAGLPRHQGDILLSNGEYLIGVHRSNNMAVRSVEDAEEIGALLNPDPASSHRVRNLDQLRCTVLASALEELPPGWQRVDNDALIVATRTNAPETSPIAPTAAS
jgi:glutamine amidotransferase